MKVTIDFSKEEEKYMGIDPKQIEIATLTFKRILLDKLSESLKE